MTALRESLLDAKRDLINELQPAGKGAVRDAYERLAAVYQFKTADDPGKRVAMWVDTFESWPLCALKAAVKAWSLKDTPFMPSPGQFNACGEYVIEERRADLADVRRIIGLMDKPEDKDWDSFVPDPEVARKLRRLMTGLRNGEDLRALRARGEI